MKLDSAVAEVLKVDLADTSVTSAGGGGCSSASTSKITVKSPNGREKRYFMKTGSGKDAEVMFQGEQLSSSRDVDRS
jgi:protein-ribulosamine 3-kinase